MITALRRLLRSKPRASAEEWGSPCHGALHDQVRNSAPVLRRILEQNIAPFWVRDKVDELHGGYLVNHDAAGTWRGPAPKFLVAQSRMLWFHSRMVRAGCDTPHRQQANAGFAFLRDNMWNNEQGGFHWSVHHAGHTVLNDEQRVYGQAFALFALAEYARCSGQDDATRLAQDTFNVLEQQFHDPLHGGYFTARNGNSGKLQNDHLHLFEALLSLREVAPSDAVTGRLWELMLILSRTVLREHHPSSADWHSRDWRPAPGDNLVSYGHDIESGWLLLHGLETLGASTSLLLPNTVAMFENLVTYGVNSRTGGIWYQGRTNRQAHDRRHIWWVQAEVLVGCCDLYVRTGLPRAGEAYLALLQFIERTQADWNHGEWHSCITPDGKPEGDKAGEWKCPYHTTRAMLECLERIELLEPQVEEEAVVP